MAIGSIAALGCDRGPRDLQDEKGPAPQVVWSSPSDNAMGVALRQSVRIQFDRFLRADTASRQSICIQPGPSSPCIGASIEYDPVDRVLVAKLQADLLPNTNYVVNVWAPSAQEPERGVRAFDDVPMAGDASFRFTSGTSASMPTLAEPTRTVEFCGMAPAPGAVFKGCTACHAPSEATDLSGAAFHLKEADKGVAKTVGTLVTQATVAIETATGPDPIEVRRSGGTFGQNMPYIDANNPANSYLLYKLMVGAAQEGGGSPAAPCLFDPNEAALKGAECAKGSDGVEPWVPAGGGKLPVVGEHDRLLGRLVGNGMTGVDLAKVRTISAWIAAGAVTPAAECP